MTPYHDPEGDRIAHLQFCLIADKIEADPSLLRIPLANIARWLGNGHWAKKELAQWRTWIEAAQASSQGMQRLLDLLRDDSEQAREWKGWEPFPGVLNKDEMEPLTWTSRH